MKPSRIFISSLLNEVVGVLLITAVWAGISLFYPPYIIPSPASVVTGISAYLPGDFSHHLWITAYRVAAGFLIAFGTGTLSGVIAAILKWNKPLNSLMVALQVVPGTILGVIFLLMFGIGSATPILLIVVLTLPILAINTVNGSQKETWRMRNT
jgi:ABC-type nitrate/sulfonate/bicarbonate transport system permease component